MLSGKEYSSNTKLDIWALGVILYRMVEGCYPFEGKNNKETFSNIYKGKLEFNQKIKLSAPLKRLIEGLLEKNIRYRIDDDNPLFEEWFNYTFEKKTIEDATSKNSKLYKKMKKNENSYEDLKNIDFFNKYFKVERGSKLFEDENDKKKMELTNKVYNNYLSQTKSTSMKCKPKIFYIKHNYSYMKKNSSPFKIETNRSLTSLKRLLKKNTAELGKAYNLEQNENENEKNITNNNIFLPRINNNNIINNNTTTTNNSKNILDYNSEINSLGKKILKQEKNMKSFIYKGKDNNTFHNYNNFNVNYNVLSNGNKTHYMAKSNDNSKINDLNKDLNLLIHKYKKSNLKYGISNDIKNKINFRIKSKYKEKKDIKDNNNNAFLKNKKYKSINI